MDETPQTVEEYRKHRDEIIRDQYRAGRVRGEKKELLFGQLSRRFSLSESRLTQIIYCKKG